MSLRSVNLVLIATAALLFTPSAALAAWTVPPTPNVADASSTNLSAVDCSSANSCMAVGHARSLGGGTLSEVTVAERWDGASWQIVPTPNPPGSTFTSLNGVSCPRANVCFAVGTGGLVELWNGTSWSIQPTPDVGGGELDGVSCSGVLACTAVGCSGALACTPVGAGALDTLAERWDGTGWKVQSTPNAAGAQSSALAAVSCPLRRTCTAVGQSVTGGVISPLVERWFGRVNSWGLQDAPTPAGAESASFAGVSCPDGPVCLAVGSSQFPGDGPAVMAERRVGPNWSVLPTPPVPMPDSQSELLGVSCPVRRDCRSTGWHSGSQLVPIAEHFDGTTWQLESIPGPQPPFPFLAGVSCPNRLFCMAVGGWNIRSLGGTLSAKWTP
jgi:hypothetical protein